MLTVWERCIFHTVTISSMSLLTYGFVKQVANIVAYLATGIAAIAAT